MKAYIFIGLAVNAIPGILAFCCSGAPLYPLGPSICQDQTYGTPCCATGPCNIFCCNCDGHCRTPNGLLEASNGDEQDPDVEAFAVADAAGNGNLTLGQYLEYMNVKDEAQIWVDWFHQHDKNGDGVITEDEVETVPV